MHYGVQGEMFMSKKSSGKTAAMVIVFVVILAGVSGGIWYYMDTQLKATQAQATNLQNQINAQGAAANAAYLDITTAGDFDFIDEIDANGGVAADATPNDATPAPTMDIVNLDTNDAATNVYITMWDPSSSTGGVPVALEDTSMSFYITWNGITIPLYLNIGGLGSYTNGVNIGNIPIGGTVSTITLSAIVDAAADNVYDDSAATYTVRVFVYQADAQSATPVTFTLLT